MNERANPVLWLVIGLPLLAVAGSFISLALATSRGDPELPKDYHWEGAALEHDQARIALAAQRGINATVAYDAGAGRCTVALRGAAPPALRLALVHPVDPRSDLRLELQRAGADYEAACPRLAAAHWRLEVADEQGEWLLRGRAQGALLEPVRLGAVTPGAAEAP